MQIKAELNEQIFVSTAFQCKGHTLLYLMFNILLSFFELLSLQDIGLFSCKQTNKTKLNLGGATGKTVKKKKKVRNKLIPWRNSSRAYSELIT